MADTQYGLFSYTVQDQYGTKTQTVVPFAVDPATITYANLKSAGLDAGTDLSHVLDGAIVHWRITLEYEPDEGWLATPASTSFVERTGVLNFSNATTRYKFPIKLPSFDQSKLVAGKIDLSDTDVANLIGLLTSTFTGGVYVNNGLYPLLALVDAFLAVRRYRRQLDRSSYEPGS